MPKKKLGSNNKCTASAPAQEDSESDSSYASGVKHEDAREDASDGAEYTTSVADEATQSDEYLEVRKDLFYGDVDKSMNALQKDQKTTHAMTEDLFGDAFNFLMSIKNASTETRARIMTRYPNKVAYKWLKKDELLSHYLQAR